MNRREAMTTPVTHYVPQESSVKIVWITGDGKIVSDTIVECPHQAVSISEKPCGCRSVLYKSGASMAWSCQECRPDLFNQSTVHIARDA